MFTEKKIIRNISEDLRWRTLKKTFMRIFIKF